LVTKSINITQGGSEILVSVLNNLL